MEGDERMRNTTKLTPLGKYITKTLVDREMSKAELAEKIGIAPQYLNCIIRGVRSGKKYIPRIITVLKLDPEVVKDLTA